jgi:hypothetical protein
MAETNLSNKPALKPWIKESVYGVSLLIIGGIVGALIQNAMNIGISTLDILVLVIILVEVVILLGFNS